MSALPWPARAYVVGLVLCALLLAVGLLSLGGAPSSQRALAAIGCSCLIAAAWLRPLPLGFKRKLYLDSSVLMLIAILFEPGLAMLISASGTLLAQAVRNRDWIEGAFNGSQIAIQAAAGSLLLASAGFDRTLNGMDHPLTVVLIVVAGTAMYLVNIVLVAAMVAVQSAMPLSDVIRRSVVDADPSEHLAYFAQVGTGAAGAVFVLAAPWMIVLLSFPVVAIYATMARNVQLRWRAEMALRDRDADLAEAQRIARLGSWQWNIKTGSQSWSDETYKLLGFDRHTITPTFEALMSSVHPDDRSMVDAAIHTTLHDETPFSIEHRVCLPAGEELTVHHRGEVILDEDGNKVRLAGTIQDITERKTLEAKIEDLAERDRIAAELAEGRRRLATSRELERQRLARELHDGPIQDLLAISYSLAAHRKSIGNGRGAIAVADVSEEIRQEILGVVDQLRGFVGELRPPGLAEFGLKAALEGYVAELCRRDGNDMPNISMEIEDVPHLPESLAMTTFRIVQEALRNAIRHAGAEEVSIQIRPDFEGLRLIVADDGRGFAVPERLSELADRGHFGLIGLAERVDQAHGTIEITSEPGSGTKINVTLPLSRSREHHAGHDSSRTRG